MAFNYDPPQDVFTILINHQTEMKKLRGTAQFGLGSIINKIVKEWADCRQGKKIPKPAKIGADQAI